jgi:hypothetical protein
MTATLPTASGLPSTDDGARSNAQDGSTSPPPTGGRRWPIAGIVAGVATIGSAQATLSSGGLSKEEANLGVDLVPLLDRGGYHIGFVVGLVAIGSLMVAAAGWKRWAEDRAPRDLAARTIGQGLSLTATVMTIFVGFTGALALYLPGGTDEGWQPAAHLYNLYSMLDFGILLAWWGAAMSAGCVAVISLRKDRLLPRWMGIVSIVLLAMPLGLAAFTALPGLVGFFLPIWLVIVSIGMTRPSANPATRS